MVVYLLDGVLYQFVRLEVDSIVGPGVYLLPKILELLLVKLVLVKLVLVKVCLAYLTTI